MKKINFSWIKTSLDLSGDVFIHPTNSSYGIGASIYNKQWYQKIYEIKQRDNNKPFFITISDINDISNVAIYDKRIDEYLHLYPQKTFTFILHRSDELPEFINPEFTTVGVQIASWALLEVSKLCWWYMFGTSANISWEWSLYKSAEIEDQFSNLQDIVFLDAWDLEKREVSTIIDLTQTPEKLLRWSLV